MKGLNQMWKEIENLIPAIQVPKRKEGWITPHCYKCKAQLPHHHENCIHYKKQIHV